MTFVVSLTGGIGSGKSAVAALFARRGITVVDTDAIAHELTSPGGGAMEAILESFGSDFITPEGALDRARMRALVFRDPQSKRRLERILHPRIRAESAVRIAAASSPYVILVVPLLVEAGVDRARYQRVMVVDCDEDVQIERVMRRSHLPDDEVRRIMASQVGRQERREAADDVVDNSEGLDDLEPQVEALHRRYLALAREHPRHGD
ncbi:MAG: dephospho-CoA kinase [Betaproteobacteria bacterium RIFCSPLOWO2_02_FULL_65_20]|nr:MAG: dephospho-CoA kinase [Betaproteobacteria bacterium RIFCSPLOWO2_02_FULL_65_20]